MAGLANNRELINSVIHCASRTTLWVYGDWAGPGRPPHQPH